MSVSSNELLHIWKSYNESNSQFLELYRSIQTRSNPVAIPPVRTSNRRTQTSLDTATTPSWIRQLFSTERSPYVSDISYSWIFEIPNSLSSSANTTRLSQKQIQENTRTFVNRETDTEQLITGTCPISHNDFQTGDILCEINTCKHVFKQGEILRWFDINTSCPVCRNPVVPTTTSENTNTEPTMTNQPHILDEIILTPLTHFFPPSSTTLHTPSTTNISSDDTDHMTQIMNEALETIFSGRTNR